MGANKPKVAYCVLRDKTEHAAHNTGAVGLFKPMCTSNKGHEIR